MSTQINLLEGRGHAQNQQQELQGQENAESKRIQQLPIQNAEPQEDIGRAEENHRGEKSAEAVRETVKEANKEKGSPLGSADNTLQEFEDEAGISAEKEYNSNKAQTKGGEQDVIYSTEEHSQGNHENETGNTVRENVASGEPIGRDGKTVEQVDRSGERNRSSERLHGDRAATGRTQDVDTGKTAAHGTEQPDSGDTGRAGSVIGEQTVQSDNDGGTKGNAENAASNGQVNASVEKQIKEELSHPTVTDEDTAKSKDTAPAKEAEAQKTEKQQSARTERRSAIKRLLSFLTPLQKDNVDAIDERFTDKGEAGMMITDGTGTGKTFTGLGTVKWAVEHGKKNILIISPNDAINKEWIKVAAEKFGLSIDQLQSTKDAGKGIVITTYANLRANGRLVKERDWDLVIADEAHNLMSSMDARVTGALSHLRALTLQHDGYQDRAYYKTETPEEERLRLEFADIESKLEQQDAQKITLEEAATLRKEREDKRHRLYQIGEQFAEERRQLAESYKEIPKNKKPKVVFLTATPFAYDKNVQYGEGYLFDYPQTQNTGGYNQAGAYEQFMITNFGYRMRYNKLTKPDNAVNSRVMEVNFHNKLKESGALRGQSLDVEKDYSRGFLLVGMGVGSHIEDGFNYLSENQREYPTLYNLINKQWDKRKRAYLLESIKARESVPIIREYLKSNKKVVLFHDTNKPRVLSNPFVLSADLLNRLAPEVAADALAESKRLFEAQPQLKQLSTKELKSPLEIYQEAFGDAALYFNGTVSEAKRNENLTLFNDDNSGKDLIICQKDAANAGVNLHDTTGKHQRALIVIGTPERPTHAIQIEGRIYRLGTQSNAIIRYLSTGSNMESALFADTIASRVGTAENLAMGEAARSLRDSFINLYNEVASGEWERHKPGAEGEDIGGKELDHSIENDLTDYDKAKSLYFGRQKRNSRNKAEEGTDYFATPEPLGVKMVQWGAINTSDHSREIESVLEPSAGHGAISRFFPENAKITIIEPSATLSSQAKLATDGGATLYRQNFEEFDIHNKFDVITMNPPFGVGGKTAMEHVAKAFKHLNEGGRIVAIIPNGPAMDKRFNEWVEGDEAKTAVVRAELKLPACAFERAGTKVNGRVVVIDKVHGVTAVKEFAGKTEHFDLSQAANINDFFDEVENFEMPPRLTQEEINVGRRTPKRETSGQTVTGEFSQQGGVFTASTFERTDNHKQVPRATIGKYLSDGTYKKVNAIAKKHGGFFSRYAKGFLFEKGGDEGRNSFIEEATAVVNESSDNTSYSVKRNANKNDGIYGEENLKNDADNWSKSVDDFMSGVYNSGAIPKIMNTPLVFSLVAKQINSPVKVGLPLKIRYGILGKILKTKEIPGVSHGHALEMTPEIIKELPKALADPVMILRNRLGDDVSKPIISDEVVVVVNIQYDNKTVIVPITFKEQHGAYYVKTAFPKNNTWVIKRMMLGDVLYINKEKTSKWIEPSGHQSPIGIAVGSSSFNNIPNENDLVKLKKANSPMYSVAYHGSPYVFDTFSLEHIGSGEGAQAHGWGLYFAQDKDTAQEYRSKLALRTKKAYSLLHDGKRLSRKIENFIKLHLSKTTLYNAAQGQHAAIQDDLKQLKEDFEHDYKLRNPVLDIVRREVNRIQSHPDMTVDEFMKNIPVKYKDLFISIVGEARKIAAQEKRELNSTDILTSLNKELSWLEVSDANRIELAREGMTMLNKLDIDKITVQGGIGSVFEVNVPEDDVLLDEQKNINEQPEKVQKAIRKAWEEIGYKASALDDMNGHEFYNQFASEVGSQKAASEKLNAYGIKGITYDGRIDGRCYVVFDDKAIEVRQQYEAAIWAHQADIKRSVAELTAEMKDALRTAKNVQIAGNDIIFTMANGNKIYFNVKEKIVVSGRDAEKARKDHGLSKAHRGMVVEGYSRPIDQGSVIVLSQDSRKGTAYHEVFHSVWDLVLNTKEKNAMLNYFKPKAEQRSKAAIELMADGYKAWKEARKRRQGTIFGKLYQKIYDFLNAAHAFFTGVENVHNIYRKIENGDVWKRDAQGRFASADEAGTNYLVTNRNINENTLVPVVDVSRIFANFINPFNAKQQALWARSMIGTLLPVNGTLNGIGFFQTMRDAKHLFHGSGSSRTVNDLIRRKALAAINDILQNAIYIEKRTDSKTNTNEKWVDLFAPVKNDNMLYCIQIQAKETDANSGEYQVGKVSFYDIKNRGSLPKGIRLSRSQSGFNDPLAITVAELLENVKDRNRNDYVTNGQLNFAPVSYSVRPEQVSKVDDIQAGMERQQQAQTEAEKKKGTITVEEKKRPQDQKFGILDTIIRSPSYLAEKYPKFKGFYRLADKAMQTQERLRNKFDRHLKRIVSTLETEEEMQTWNEILLQGDAEGKEYTTEELQSMGANDNVIKAYKRTRQAVRLSYNQLNDARQQVHTVQQEMSEEDFVALKQKPFTEIVKVDALGDGNVLVAYKQPKTWRKTETVTKEVLDGLKEQDNVAVLHARQLSKDTFMVTWEEKMQDIHKRGGYIPHFFHEYFVAKKDADGKKIIVGSGRTVKDATVLAEKYLQEHEGEDVAIFPKGFTMSNEETMRAAVVGDGQYFAMLSKVQEELGMSVKEAEEFLDGKVRMQGRHRFFGNFLQRKGAEGYETDMQWILRHYFNATARYVALEEFKPKAIGLYERYFGSFQKDQANNPLASYTRDYINDINGNPSVIENMLNNFLNNSKWYRDHVAANYGERAALQVAGNITGKISVLKLGFLNVSSALLNMSQLINTIGLLGKVKPVVAGLNEALHPGKGAMRIFKEAGIANTITLDTSSGYTKLRLGDLGSKSMYLFRKGDMLARQATVLAAYRTARAAGKSHTEAINFAKDINRKANFDYGVADAPNVFRRGSVFAQLALQFKKFPIKEIELMGELLSKGSFEQNAKFWGTYLLICGLFQVPMADWFDEMFKDLFGWSPKLKAKKAIMEAAGDDPFSREVAKVAMYGILAAEPVGADVSARVGVGDVSLSIDNGLAGTLGGPTVNTAQQFAKAFNDGSTVAMVKALSPALGNYMQAAIGHTEGSRGRTGRKIDTMYDTLLQASGWRNVEDSVARDVSQIMQAERKERTSDRKAVMDRVIAKLENGERLTSDDAKELRRLRITGKQLRDERMRKVSTAKERNISSASKRERYEMRDLLKFQQ